MIDSETALAWAEANEIACSAPPFPRTQDYRVDPCTDFGRVVRKEPLAFFEPSTREQLRRCCRFLHETRTPFKVRGTAHSSGGQSLIENGAVIGTGRLNRIVADDPDGETITVEGGIRYIDVLRHLIPQGRRLVVCVSHTRISVGGFLTVGGFGDTSHVYGLAGDTVERLVAVTATGEELVCDANDPIGRYILAGSGQLGIIAQVTLRTMRKSMTLAARGLSWQTVEQGLEAQVTNIEKGCYQVLKMRMMWGLQFGETYRHGGECAGIAGNLADELPERDSGPEQLNAIPGDPQLIDLTDAFTRAEDFCDTWRQTCPAVEFALPYPGGLSYVRELYTAIDQSGFASFLPHGGSVAMIMPRRVTNLPLAPLADTEYSIMVILRPELSAEKLPVWLGRMRRMAAEVLGLGGKLYMMSVEPEMPQGEFLRAQYGDELDELIRLKRQLDPFHLLNPGLLPEPEAADR